MKRFLTAILALALILSLTGVGGCGDDVRTTKKVEIHHQSDPQPVSPGEPIVE